MSDDKTRADLGFEFPLSGDDWSTAVAKFEEAKRVLENRDAMDARTAGYKVRRSMIDIAVSAEKLDFADKVFDELAAMADRDGADVFLPAFCDGGAVEELMWAHVDASDWQTADRMEKVFERLWEQFPENEQVLHALRHAMGMMATLHAGLDHAEPAIEYFNAVARSFNGRSVTPDEQNWLAELCRAMVINLIETENGGTARNLTYSMREVLLGDGYSQYLADQFGEEQAKAIRALFETQIDVYEENRANRDSGGQAEDKSVDPDDDDDDEGPLEVLDDFGFCDADMAEQTVFDCLTLAVPRRWRWHVAKGKSSAGFWEKGFDSGALTTELDVIQNRAYEDGDPEFVSSYAKQWVDSVPKLSIGIHSLEVHELSDRTALFYICNESDAGYVEYHCHLFLQRGPWLLHVTFKLILLGELVDRTDFAWLCERMAHECQNVRVDFDAAIAPYAEG